MGRETSGEVFASRNCCLPPRGGLTWAAFCGGGLPENSREHARCKTSTFCLGEAAVGLIRLYLDSGESTAVVGEVMVITIHHLGQGFLVYFEAVFGFSKI